MSKTALMSQREEQGLPHEKYLTFTLDGKIYGIEIGSVKEIVRMQRISSLPDAPEYIRGVMNLRGKIIPVLDLGLRFGGRPALNGDRSCIVNLEVEGRNLGVLAENVRDVIRIGEQDVAPAPSFLSAASENFIDGIGKTGDGMILLIHSGELFNQAPDAFILTDKATN